VVSGGGIKEGPSFIPGPEYDKIAEKVYGMWQAFIRLAITTHVGNPAAIPVARTGLGL